jgi:hypothetical protein
MIYNLDNEFYQICKEIVEENKSLAEWAEIESDDMFQSEKYEGGFDALEMEFCFSVYLDAAEYWFQLSLDSIHKIYEKMINEVELFEADW